MYALARNDAGRVSAGFLRMLGTFIGLLVFFTIITGICGVGSSADLGRIGKLMVSRYVSVTFLSAAVFVFAARFFFPLGRGVGGGSFLAENSGVTADTSWWIILVLVSALLAIATPPVAGGVLSCLSILMLQLQIPQEALALGVTLLMLMDFPSTAVRVLTLHLEMVLQADRLGLLDVETLRADAKAR